MNGSVGDGSEDNKAAAGGDRMAGPPPPTTGRCWWRMRVDLKIKTSEIPSAADQISSSLVRCVLWRHSSGAAAASPNRHWTKHPEQEEHCQQSLLLTAENRLFNPNHTTSVVLIPSITCCSSLLAALDGHYMKPSLLALGLPTTTTTAAQLQGPLEDQRVRGEVWETTLERIRKIIYGKSYSS